VVIVYKPQIVEKPVIQIVEKFTTVEVPHPVEIIKFKEVEKIV
tara:strand:- start:24 stop:152 length:129 start_codon:yes stop_codon:yes gene_type:complete